MSAKVDWSAERVCSVTPSDTTPISFGTSPPAPTFARRLYIGVTGDVTLIAQDGTTILYKSVPVGYLWVATSQVKATGTTASQIVAEYF